MEEYQLAFNEQYDTMVIMGISDCQEKLRFQYYGESKNQSSDDRKVIFDSLPDDDQKRLLKLNDAWWWTIQRGACMLFGIPHAPVVRAEQKGNSFFNRVSMRKGPGDIVKGSFTKK